MRGVVDRFVSGFGVVIVGQEEFKLIVPKGELPKNTEEGDWMKLKFIPDKKYTQERREKIEEMLDDLIEE
ncbi:hypothetical protein JCM16358_10970 [Halanaerocella petrolearia]